MSYWDVFRSLIDQLAHEDDLLVDRTLWLFISQPLLLVCYFLVDTRRLPPAPNQDFFRIIGTLGVLSTIFIYSAILAAVMEFVELRTRIQLLLVDHPDLPMRQLPSAGIGSGLVCPILSALLFLYCWVLLTARSRGTAVLTVVSGALFGVFFVGGANGLVAGSTATVLVWASLPAAIAVLAAAALNGFLASRVHP